MCLLCWPNLRYPVVNVGYQPSLMSVSIRGATRSKYPPSRVVQDTIVEVLRKKGKPMTVRQIGQAVTRVHNLDEEYRRVRRDLTKLCRAAKIVRVAPGLYGV
jgi:hypothetical protein